MTRTRRRTIRTEHVGHVGRAHGRAWNSMEWYVPFYDGHGIIYHGHEDTDDHSKCGPKIFCCPKAAHLLLQSYPDDILANVEWEFMDGKPLVSWMGQNGPQVYYFFFCDPEDRNVLRFIGVAAPEVREVLLKRLTLDRYLEDADRICAMHE